MRHLWGNHRLQLGIDAGVARHLRRNDRLQLEGGMSEKNLHVAGGKKHQMYFF